MNITEELLYELLYEKNNKELIAYVADTTDADLLHMIAGNYNWDNGIDVPKSITDNKNCDLATALMIFELADGYTFLLGDTEELPSKKWIKFVSDLKDKIEKDKFPNKSIKYVPDLSRVIKFKIKKMCPDINSVFIDGTDGELLEIITV